MPMPLSFTKYPSKQPLALYAAKISAGFPSPAEDHMDGKLDLSEHLIRRPAATYFVRVEGESMQGAGIFDGDLLIVDRGIQAKADDVVIAVVHGDLTVKRLTCNARGWALSAANPSFADIPLTETGCEVWGVVAHSIRRHCNR